MSVKVRGLRPPFFMSERYDFYDDDWYDGAAQMTLRGRKAQLETLFNLSDAKKEEE